MDSEKFGDLYIKLTSCSRKMAFNPDHREEIPSEVGIEDAPSLEDLQCLREQGYTEGMVRALVDEGMKPAQRFWIIDNSGSMNTNDGHRLVATRHRNQVKISSCTRWEELRECIR